ncbi:MAG: hypothetical protein JJ902_23590 [Roseibium sp.]|nr:hypothetical protein [Roseibium sp.]
MKKRIDIEKLLKWAYCEELPKAAGESGGSGGGGSWLGGGSFVELLTVIDDNRYGVVPDLAASGEPHPDALTLHAAVSKLDEGSVSVPADWNPMPELSCYGHHADLALTDARAQLFIEAPDGKLRWRRPPRDLIRKHAVLGGAPDGFGSLPDLKPLRGPNGGEIWYRMCVQLVATVDGGMSELHYECDDGWDQKRRVPKRGAYRKFYLDPDPVPAVVMRQEYVLWWQCLDALVERLSGRLDAHEPCGPTRPMTPWVGDGPTSMCRSKAI